MSSDQKPFKLLAKLPKGDANGLETVYDQLKNHGTAYVLMRVSSPEVTVRLGNIREPKLVIDRIEGLPPGDGLSLQTAAERLMGRARKARGVDEPDLYDGGVLSDDVDFDGPGHYDD